MSLPTSTVGELRAELSQSPSLGEDPWQSFHKQPLLRISDVLNLQGQIPWQCEEHGNSVIHTYGQTCLNNGRRAQKWEAVWRVFPLLPTWKTAAKHEPLLCPHIPPMTSIYFSISIATAAMKLPQTKRISKFYWFILKEKSRDNKTINHIKLLY